MSRFNKLQIFVNNVFAGISEDCRSSKYLFGNPLRSSIIICWVLHNREKILAEFLDRKESTFCPRQLQSYEGLVHLYKFIAVVEEILLCTGNKNLDGTKDKS